MNDIVITSRIRLARNLSDIPFPIKMNDYDAANVIDRVRNVIMQNKQYHFDFLEMKKLPLIKRQVLIEKHLISPALASSKIKSAVAIDQNENISIMINEEDHLRIQVLYRGQQIQKAWEDANRIDDFLEQHLPYAYDETWGYLTSCPTNVGTGLRASFMLHLPALTLLGYMKGIIDTITKLGIAVRGFYGEGSEAAGNLYQISNQITLGQPEEDIIANVISITNQIIEQEQQARLRLLSENRAFVEDKVYRAYGILKYARNISSNEALKLISDVRMGISMGIIKETTIDNLDVLLNLIQPAIIQDYFGREMTPEERDIKRAELIRKILE
ncbi:ATP:guanido phosphotransferase [Caldicellulosiruptor obsidiansis OB47]|uniref:Protein-arginine kinase n=1 Tax=Caldicellulosiruptor obsidiansis (strain ATCC BAA-2073 / JCM 16842 / OB47) TaxID=608506 RepID=D9TFF1_CALOO|nr:protein arginine kinase [Caldicellulosiruptor obsidiansis]ADL42921.1 ATP:guanido phosphotransferase [Caldicellulosiruptor obsidiansis OB47]